MALVTGVLSDFGMSHLDGLFPSLRFQPSGPALDSLRIYSPQPEYLTKFSADGLFQIDLQPNDSIHPATYYTLHIQSSNGISTELPWKLFVPAEGGRLADLLKNPANPAAVWIGTTPPENPSPGTWWLDPVTGELKEWKI